jgi:hypothetical protein
VRYPRDGNRTSGKPYPLAAPTRGLKTDSALLGLAPEYAITLDNLICQPDALVTRLGYTEWLTGLTGQGSVLFQYHSGSVQKLFVADSVGVYDASSAGAVGSAVAARTTGRGRSTQFSTSAGHFLYYVNGVDSPLLFDGTTWTAITGVSSPAITGPTTSLFAHVISYRQRLMFLPAGKLSFYYLAVDSVSGAATEFRLGSLLNKGGVAIGQAVWTIDGGEGQDDLYVIASSEGEVVIFGGSDPADPTAWAPLGVFDLGKPVSRDCFLKFGGDLLYLSEAGIYPLSKALVAAGIDRSKTISTNIDPTISSAIRTYKENDGWQMIAFPRWSLVILNVPGSPSFQYVYNTQSRGWSRFTGLNAVSWADYEGSVFFCDGDKVFKAFDGPADNGAAIPWTFDSAYNRFGALNQQHPLLVRPLLAQNIPSEYSIGFAQDFTNRYLSQTVPRSGGTGGLWDSGLWDTALWGGAFVLQRDWRTVAARGGVAQSLRLAGSSNLGSTIILGADIKLSQQSFIV